MLTTEQPLIAKSQDKNKVLFHELQLGSELNKSIHSKRRADFSLMLAMLTEDVREHSQFFVPKTKFKEREYSDEALRKAFQLPKKAPLALQNINELEKLSQAHLVAKQQIATLHLQNVLSPPPFAFHDDPSHIPSDVLNDTSIHCQIRLKQQKTSDEKEPSLNAAAFFNAKFWLDNIQKSLINGSNIHLQTA
jgi:hypothetical protein